MDSVHEIRSWKVEEILRDGLALVIEEGVSVGSEIVLNVVDHDFITSKEKKRGVQKIPSRRPLFNELLPSRRLGHP
jgi:hypothetical protein